MQWRAVRPSVCKLLRKSFLLTGKWPDRHQTCTRWTPDQRASSVLKVKVKVKGHVIRVLSWILGISYSVIDGLVILLKPVSDRISLNTVADGRTVEFSRSAAFH